MVRAAPGARAWVGTASQLDGKTCSGGGGGGGGGTVSVTAPPPVFVIVTMRLSLSPTATGPNVSDAGLTSSWRAGSSQYVTTSPSTHPGPPKPRPWHVTAMDTVPAPSVRMKTPALELPSSANSAVGVRPGLAAGGSGSGTTVSRSNSASGGPSKTSPARSSLAAA